MDTQALARWGFVAALIAAACGCRPPPGEGRAPGTHAVQQPPAAQADAAPAVAEPAVGQPETGPTTADDVTGFAPLVEFPGGAPTFTGWSDLNPEHQCLEPPERIAARERMRRRAAEHERLAGQLAVLRAELQSQMAAVAESLDIGRITSIAADLAQRNAQLPDPAPEHALFLGAVLRQAALWGALCKTLDGCPLACRRLEVNGDSDLVLCQSIARLVRLANLRPERLSFWSALGWAFGWTWNRQIDERIWQIVARAKGEASCTKLDGSDPADHWAGPVCRALAARDVSRCDALGEWPRRSLCVALVHAILGPATAAGDVPSAAAIFLRERVAPTKPRTTCAEALAPIFTEMLDDLDVFELAPLAFPEIEYIRGLAPARQSGSTPDTGTPGGS